MKTFVIDIARCPGCYSCQIVCKDEHCGNDWTPYAKPQPETGQFWLKIQDHVRGTVPKVKMAYVPELCNHCDNATCISVCPVEAIYRRDDGLILIDPKKCNGCQNCLDSKACPYGVIFFNYSLNIAQKCTGCAHLIDKGWEAPRCADVCPEALKFGEESELDLSGTEILHPEYGLAARVHYKNLPKRFIAGTVYDSGKEEIVKDAVCTLTGTAGTANSTTDGFGDFWFEGLAEDTFSLKIEAPGYTTWTKDSINTKDADINLGDIALA